MLVPAAMHRCALLGLAVSLAGCGPSTATPVAVTPTRPTSSIATPPTTPSSAAPALRALPELAREFEAEGTRGTIALFDTNDGVLSCSDVERCQQGFPPASTFKIPNSMIALETDVVEGPDSVMKWDGQQYPVAAWNEDLKFRDAFRVSCVPCYQAVARKVGEPVEHEWVEKLDYGNHDTSGGVDKFWLVGGLRITPLQQIDFLRRFDGNKLPISERTADIVRDIMTIDVTETYVLRAKTGAVPLPKGDHDLGWFVGWLEMGERRVFFATLILDYSPSTDMMPLRRKVTERVLKARGLM
jgi:beta-lactamase class D